MEAVRQCRIASHRTIAHSLQPTQRHVVAAHRPLDGTPRFPSADTRVPFIFCRMGAVMSVTTNGIDMAKTGLQIRQAPTKLDFARSHVPPSGMMNDYYHLSCVAPAPPVITCRYVIHNRRTTRRCHDVRRRHLHQDQRSKIAPPPLLRSTVVDTLAPLPTPTPDARRPECETRNNPQISRTTPRNLDAILFLNRCLLIDIQLKWPPPLNIFHILNTFCLTLIFTHHIFRTSDAVLSTLAWVNQDVY